MNKTDKIKKSIENIIVKDDVEEKTEEKEKIILKEQKPKRLLLRANEQIER